VLRDGRRGKGGMLIEFWWGNFWKEEECTQKRVREMCCEDVNWTLLVADRVRWLDTLLRDCDVRRLACGW
jgi:hypothetical protein